MSEATNQEKLKDIFCNLFSLGPGAIHDQLSADDVEAWDSLQHLNLVLSIEEEFGISVTPEEVQKYYEIKITSYLTKEGKRAQVIIASNLESALMAAEIIKKHQPEGKNIVVTDGMYPEFMEKNADDRGLGGPQLVNALDENQWTICMVSSGREVNLIQWMREGREHDKFFDKGDILSNFTNLGNFILDHLPKDSAKAGIEESQDKTSKDEAEGIGMKKPGGIDFNANHVNLEQEGQGFQFDQPQLTGQNLPRNIRGIHYQIKSVTLVANFNLLLGRE